jgi:hypothetical protein
MVGEDENYLVNDQPVAAVAKEQRKKIKYACGPCKHVANRPSLTCIVACEPGEINHNW